MGNIETLTNEHNATLRWHDEMHEMFDVGLGYDEVVTFNITKEDLTGIFANPKMGILVDSKKSKLLIKWCTHDAIHANFWDHWWMVFDIPPQKFRGAILFPSKIVCRICVGPQGELLEHEAQHGCRRRSSST